MNPLVSKLSVRNGLIIGGISAVLSIVFYFINPVIAYTNFTVPILSLVIVIALLVILGIDIRKKIGGFWTYGQAYLSLLITSVFIIIISLLVSFLIMKLDPSLPGKISDAMIDVTTQRLQKYGMDQTQIDAATKSLTPEKFAPSVKNELIGFGGALVLYAIINLIIAACIKKNPPMFAPIVDEEPVVVE